MMAIASFLRLVKIILLLCGTVIFANLLSSILLALFEFFADPFFNFYEDTSSCVNHNTWLWDLAAYAIMPFLSYFICGIVLKPHINERRLSYFLIAILCGLIQYKIEYRIALFSYEVLARELCPEIDLPSSYMTYTLMSLVSCMSSMLGIFLGLVVTGSVFLMRFAKCMIIGVAALFLVCSIYLIF